MFLWLHTLQEEHLTSEWSEVSSILDVSEKLVSVEIMTKNSHKQPL